MVLFDHLMYFNAVIVHVDFNSKVNLYCPRAVNISYIHVVLIVDAVQFHQTLTN